MKFADALVAAQSKIADTFSVPAIFNPDAENLPIDVTFDEPDEYSDGADLVYSNPKIEYLKADLNGLSMYEVTVVVIGDKTYRRNQAPTSTDGYVAQFLTEE